MLKENNREVKAYHLQNKKADIENIAKTIKVFKKILTQYVVFL